MTLIPLPAFADNYIWMLHDGRSALVVDPGDSEPVLKALESEKLHLEAILVTHHHADHTGGIAFLRESTQAKVYGPARESMPTEVQGLMGGETIEVLGLQWQVLWVPGHTQGHIAYFADTGHQAPILFCGDTMFSAGCGRLFEGTAEQMHASLQTLAALPAATLLCCTHEYTLNNLRFAMQVEPDNPMLGNYYAHCQSLRANGLPTLPSTIGQERNINPFLRSEQASIINSAQQFNPAGFAKNGCFATLRHWKNEYQ